jgi:hypothetical protein
MARLMRNELFNNVLRWRWGVILRPPSKDERRGLSACLAACRGLCALVVRQAHHDIPKNMLPFLDKWKKLVIARHEAIAN